MHYLSLISLINLNEDRII